MAVRARMDAAEIHDDGNIYYFRPRFITLYPPQSGVPDWDPPMLQRSSRRAPDTDVKASDRLYGPGDGIPRV